MSYPCCNGGIGENIQNIRLYKPPHWQTKYEKNKKTNKRQSGSLLIPAIPTTTPPPTPNKKDTSLPMAVPTEISGPRGLPLIGNALELQDEVPLRAIERIADIHGPIFKIHALGRETLIVSGFDLFDELCDETRFYKLLGGKLREAMASDPSEPQGLFTSLTEKEEDWGQAHRILMPAFGPLAVADMFPGSCSPQIHTRVTHRGWQSCPNPYKQKCTISPANSS